MLVAMKVVCCVVCLVDVSVIVVDDICVGLFSLGGFGGWWLLVTLFWLGCLVVCLLVDCFCVMIFDFGLVV